MKIGVDGLENELEGGASLKSAGGDDCPQSLAGLTAFGAAGALSDMAINDHEPDLVRPDCWLVRSAGW